MKMNCCKTSIIFALILLNAMLVYGQLTCQSGTLVEGENIGEVSSVPLTDIQCQGGNQCGRIELSATLSDNSGKVSSLQCLSSGNCGNDVCVQANSLRLQLVTAGANVTCAGACCNTTDCNTMTVSEINAGAGNYVHSSFLMISLAMAALASLIVIK